MMLSVDPGIHTGWALWGAARLYEYGTINFDGNLLHWEDKARDVSIKFDNLFKHISGPENIKEVVIEFPGYMAGTGGHMVATSGDLVKLAVITGMLMNCAMMNGASVEPVPVNRWKGQLPKEVCHERIKKVLKDTQFEKTSSHSLDAIGIGLWKLGRFK